MFVVSMSRLSHNRFITSTEIDSAAENSSMGLLGGLRGGRVRGPTQLFADGLVRDGFPGVPRPYRRVRQVQLDRELAEADAHVIGGSLHGGLVASSGRATALFLYVG